MRKNKSTLWVFIILLAFTACEQKGCNDQTQSKVVIHIFTQKLGNDASKPFPDDFKNLFLPFTAVACDDSVVFLPITDDGGVFVERIDFADKLEIKFNFSSTLGKSVSKNTKRMESIINSDFTSKKMGNGFIKQNGNADFSKLQNFQDRIVVFSETIDGDSISVNGHTCRVFQTMKELKQFIANDLCERYHSHKNFSDYAILYKVQLSPQQSVQLTPQEFTNTQANITSHDGDKEWLNTNETNISKLDSNDFHTFYLIAQNHICGDEHIKAFTYLIKAAQIAIKYHQEIDMLGQMEEDEPTGKPMGKLSHGHHIWHHVVDALKKSDKALLEDALKDLKE